MKRDMDLVRKILMALEDNPTGYFKDEMTIDGYTEEDVGYHCYLLLQAGLVGGYDINTLGCSSPSAVASHLTWMGHEFLDASRESSRWEKAKGIAGKVGGVSFDAFMNLT